MGKFFEEIGGLLPELFKKEEAWIIIAILAVGGFFSFSFFRVSLGLGDFFPIIWDFIKATWWFWIFFPLLSFFRGTLLFWRQEEYKEEETYVILELRIPREIEKSPKSMEQIFLALHSLRNVASLAKEKYYEGEVTFTTSLELVSIGGEIHFFIRILKKYREILESSFFSYYPDVELTEVNDYMDRFPQSPEDMYRQGMRVWGTELVLARDAMYPIKSYTQFELAAEEKRLDPLSSFLEILGKVKKEETGAIQILISPADARWGEDWHEDLEKLREKLSGSPTMEGNSTTAMSPQPQKYEILKSVENNLTKPAFDTLIRLVYIAPEKKFNRRLFEKGIVSAFNQYSAVNLNSFRQNGGVRTRADIWHSPYIFPSIRLEYKTQRMLFNFIKREPPQEEWMGKFLTSHLFNWNFASRSFLLNVESLATIFHLPPAIVLTTPHMQRMESRKAGPSAGLSIFGDESELEKFS